MLFTFGPCIVTCVFGEA